MSLLAPGIAMGIPGASANGSHIEWSLILKAGVVPLSLMAGTAVLGGTTANQLGYLATYAFTATAPAGISNVSLSLSATGGGTLFALPGLTVGYSVPAALLIDGNSAIAYLPSGTTAPSPIGAAVVTLLLDGAAGKVYVPISGPLPGPLDGADVALHVDAVAGVAWSENPLLSRVSGVTLLIAADLGNAYY